MSIARTYELVYIVPPETTEDALGELQTLVTDIVGKGGGTIEGTENWGRRKLAYEIERFREGIYVLHVLNGPGEMVAELERRLRVLDVVLRHLVIRVDEDQAKAERAASRRKATTAARRERRGLPPEPDAPEGGDDDENDGEGAGGDE